VSAGSVEAFDKADSYRIGNKDENNRGCRGCTLNRKCSGLGDSDQNIDVESDKFGCEGIKSFILLCGEAVLDDNVLTF
jgi:hypothetical protein